MKHLGTLLVSVAVALGAAIGCQANTPLEETPGGGTGGEDSGREQDFQKRCETTRAIKPVLRRLTGRELTQTLLDVFPEIKPLWTDRTELPGLEVMGIALPNDTEALRVPVGVAEKLFDIAEEVGDIVTDQAFGSILPCSTGAADVACARSFLDKYGNKLFRRALTDAERDKYLQLFNSSLAKSDFKTAIKWTLVALIQSPNFIYRREIGVAQGSEYQLTPREIATELAYTFSGSLPSDELLAKAERGELSTPDALVAEAKKLLSTAAGHEVIHDFFRVWLAYDRVATQSDKANIPAFKGVSQDMVQETRNFVEEVLFTRKGNVKDLLTASYTTISPGLATYYGFPAPQSLNNGFGVVQRSPGMGIGILAQGSFLARAASPNGSSPTKRGATIYRRLFCTAISIPAVNNVGSIPPPEPSVKTTRDRYEKAHAASAYCQTCHTVIDPLGFGFEHFDEGGRFRKDEFGLTINATGSVTFSSKNKVNFDGQEQLVQALANDPGVTDCLSGYIATYAFGSSNSCLAEEARTKLASGGVGVIDFMAEIARSPNFTRRSTR